MTFLQLKADDAMYQPAPQPSYSRKPNYGHFPLVNTNPQ